MELIYAYIDKYRTFKKQKLVFSNKFIVEYEESKNCLSIERNPDYYDIYPRNIAGISAVLGKNATGKSSILALIGEKIKDRHKNNEIFKKEPENPHEKLDNFRRASEKELGEIGYLSSYFLIYYYGESECGDNLFVFETNAPYKFIKVFDNFLVLTSDNGGYGPPLDYFVSKGWFSCVFDVIDNKNRYLNDTQGYGGSERGPENLTSVIYFKGGYYPTKWEHVYDADEESKISIKRRYSTTRSAYLYNELVFLIDQMNNGYRNSGMFSDNSYKVDIELADILPSRPEVETDLDVLDIITDYRGFTLENFSEGQKITLAFLCSYTWYLFTTLIFSGGDITAEQRDCMIQIKAVETDSNTYEDIKDSYHRQINLIFKRLDNEDITVEEFLKVEGALENFLKNAKDSNIEYVYTRNRLVLEICRESNLECVKPFFEYCLDEPAIKNLDKTDSVLHTFLEKTIQNLSDGEKANLALFATIHEQIDIHHKRKQKYILLFDEIERSMHPEMCRCLISDLVDYLGTYSDKEFQVIIASHSPFITSDIRKESIICLSRKENVTIAEQPNSSAFGQNIHTILRDQFYLDCTFGEYSTRVISMVVECLKQKSLEKIEAKIQEFLHYGDTGYTRGIPYSLGNVFDYLTAIVQSIGEPIIKDQLQRKLNGVREDLTSVEDEIVHLEQELERLRKRQMHHD